MRLLTYSDWSADGRRQRRIEVADPAWVSRTADAWTQIYLYPETSDYEAHMMRQAVATRDRWRWGIEPGRHAGGVVHLIGNGPSAHDFPGTAPGEVAVAINGARALFSRAEKPDYWVVADSGYIGGPAWVARMAELARQDPEVTGILTPGSCPEIEGVLRETHWYLSANAPGRWASRFYRHLVPAGVVLPSFVSGRQTVVAALHFCWWLLGGPGEIHLWGVDMGCSAPPASLADYYAGAHAPGGAELHVADEWFRYGDGWTSEELLGVSRGVDATIAFLRDDGLRVVQHRRPGCGARLLFAELPDEEVAVIEEPIEEAAIA